MNAFSLKVTFVMLFGHAVWEAKLFWFLSIFLEPHSTGNSLVKTISDLRINVLKQFQPFNRCLHPLENNGILSHC